MNNTTTFRHPHSPKSTTPTAASATIMDRAVSSRRSAAPYSSDAEPLTCASPIRVAEAAAVDESKTKRQHLSLLASNYLSRIANSSCLVLCIVTALVVISLAFHSRSLVCLSVRPRLSDWTRVAPPRCARVGFRVSWSSLVSKHGKTVDWTSKDLLKALEEFVPIYEIRPIKNNMYGMGFDHSFGLWFITRWLKPDLVIEILRVTQLGFCGKQCQTNELFHFHPGILGSTYRRALLMLMQTARTMLEKSLWILVVLIGQV